MYEQYKAKKDALEDKYDDDAIEAAEAKFDEAWDSKLASYNDVASHFKLAVRTKFN